MKLSLLKTNPIPVPELPVAEMLRATYQGARRAERAQGACTVQMNPAAAAWFAILLLGTASAALEAFPDDGTKWCNTARGYLRAIQLEAEAAAEKEPHGAVARSR